MGLIVQKFGGTSVANAERLRNVAEIIAETYRQGNQVVAVLSAQGDTTDDLIEKAQEINPKASPAGDGYAPFHRGADLLFSVCHGRGGPGSAGGFPHRLAGWGADQQQLQQRTVKKIDVERIQSEIDRNHSIVIVTGFHGINKYGDITTLGRGGSDTSAVALAAALKADLCQIYTDVDGIYTADPRHVKGARNWRRSPSRKWLELASLGPGAPQPLCGTGQEVSGEFGSAVQLREKAGHESQGGCQRTWKRPRSAA